MSDSSPFSGASQYATTVQYGIDGGNTPGAADTAVDVIKDATTASFSADVIQESRKQPVLVDF